MEATATEVEVCTSGYQGEHVEQLIEKLVAAKVTMLVDVRRRAHSRKPGFSKTALSNALGEAGIAYTHLRQLGMPEELMPLRNLTDNSPILHEYRNRMMHDNSALEPLRDMLSEHRVCLLCFESDHRQCHRHIIPELLDVESRHL